MACKLYEEKIDFREARNKIVELNKELGWFQAPGNVAFVILGLLYGEGDFKKSMIYAINCGDDTDCTGATIGSLMGIMYGTESIPKEWTEYIGDRIITVALDRAYTFLPKTCEELTQRTLRVVPSALAAFGVYMEYTDGENELEGTPVVRSPPLSLPEGWIAERKTVSLMVDEVLRYKESSSEVKTFEEYSNVEEKAKHEKVIGFL